MINPFRAIPLGVALMCLALPAAAEWYHSEAGSVSIFIPDHWTVEVENEYEMSATTGDGAVGLGMRVSPGGDIEAAIASLDQAMLDYVSDFQMVHTQELSVNGMAAVGGEATGLVEGQAVELGLLVVATPTNHALLVFGIGLPEAIDHYQGDLDNIFQSISPLANPDAVAVAPDIWVDENCEWAEVNGTTGYVAEAGDAGLLHIFSEADEYLVELPQGVFPQCGY